MHKTESDGKQTVSQSSDRHRTDQPNGDIAAGVLGLFGHGGDGVEAYIGEEENRGGFENPADAFGSEIRVVFGVGFAEAGDDDEDDDDDVDDGGDVVEAGRALGAEDGEYANDGDDRDGDGI